MRVKIQNINLWTITFLLGSVFLLVIPATGLAATQAQYNALPPFLGTEVPPNVMFMLDNSGSMKNLLADGKGYNPAKEPYYGMFEGTSKYKYDTSINLIKGFNRGSTPGSPTNSDEPYHVSNVAATIPGAFVEDNSCTIGAGNNCWDGSFLNWLVTRRIDAARKVLVGGKVEYRTGADYITGDGGDLEWKIVANNERSDRNKAQSSSHSGSYTPYPDNTAMTVYSPAESGAEITSGNYDPYAKLKVKVPEVVINSSGGVIGEYGTVADCGADGKDGKWCTVTLGHNYTSPVVVAGPMTYEGSDPSVVRISAVDAATDTFKVRIEEWEYKDGGHATEDISYLVLEDGAHELAGGQKLFAGTADISSTGNLSDDFNSIDISSAIFIAVPVVLTSVTTNNDDPTVTTRQRNVSITSFQVALQEEMTGGSHNTETVSFIALDQGDYSDGGATSFQVAVEANVDADLKDGWETISFTDEGITPAFLASMQTTDGPDTAVLRYKNLDSDSVEIIIEEEASDGTDNDGHTPEDVGYVVLSSTATNEFNLVLIVEDEPKGLLHDIADKVRLGISLYNYKLDNDIYNDEIFHGGTLKPKIPLNPFVKDADDTGFRTVETYIDAGIDGIVDAIEHYPLVWGTTPLAENYYDVIRYFQQVPSYYETVNGVPVGSYYEVNNHWDPYYCTADGLVPCAPSYVLVFTDGEPYRDYYMPGYNSGSDDYSGSVGSSADYDGDGGSRNDDTSTADLGNGNDALDDLAFWANSVVDQSTYAITGDRDLRTDMSGKQNIKTYTVGFGSDALRQVLVDTAKNGGGLAYAAEDGRELKTQLTSAFTDILSRSSGTAASVISNSRGGEGAIYQSVFFPKLTEAETEVNWVGQVHSLLVDAYGNMREDTTGDSELDLVDDYIVVFQDNGTADLYKDGDGNQRLEIEDASCPTIPPLDTTCYDSFVGNVELNELNYLWNSSNWLNEISDSAVEIQRISYISNEAARYIWAWVDGDDDGLVDPGEVVAFSSSAIPADADLIDADEIYPYLHLYPSFNNRPSEVGSLSSTNLTNFIRVQSKRQINWIRGSDCVDSSDPEDCNTLPLTIGGVALPNSEMRSRQYDYDDDGDLNTWRLGDIVYSTPTLVGRPAENFHLLYNDLSYAPFVYKYKNRRQVVYSGANDGMVHAFNAGFFDRNNKRFCKSSDFTNCNASSEPDLGAELWAYVPYNLLPHLYWLTQSSYNEEKHTYYVDQKPRIFDAQIFTEETDCGTNLYAAACVHPNGWGTVMVIGMNLGGGTIIADMNKTDGDSPKVADDRTMKSAFLIFDITNPEAEPKLLAELTMPGMGFSTSYPTVVTMKDGNHNGAYQDYAAGENKWYLLFGSGPADTNGDPGTMDAATGEYDDEILNEVKSTQAAKLYLLDLVELASNNVFKSLDDDDGALTAGLHSFVTLDANSFVSAPVTVDYDLDYNADAVYFGTVSGSNSNWAGKLRRVVIDDDNSESNWAGDSVLIDAAQPIVAAPSIGKDDEGENWVFFGTGRYFTTADKADTSSQSYYGLKESANWSTLSSNLSTLVNVTDFEVFTDRSIVASSVGADAFGDGNSEKTWEDLLADQSTHDGWYLNFSTGERNVGQAALLGGLLSFTTFIPESDICAAGGSSYLWGLYYKSGTAYYEPVLGTTDVAGKTRADKKYYIGPGLATSPTIHVGRKSGSTIFVQSSTGKITSIEQENPHGSKSGMSSWRLQ